MSAHEHNKKQRRFFTLKNKRHMPRWLAWLLAWLLKLYFKTLRLKVEDSEGWLESADPESVVIAIWHNRILFLPCAIPSARRSRCTVLISSSRDGEYISGIVRHFQLGVVRGSSSKGGLHALLELDSELKAGRYPVLTIDGPRGPRYGVHPGAVVLAKRNHVPVLPVTLDSESCWQAKSWDGTQIPKPFSRVTLRIGQPIDLEGLPIPEAQARVREKLLALALDPSCLG